MSMKREPRRIMAWMALRGLKTIDLARELGVTRPLVSATIHGHRNNRRVLKLLVKRGCPARYLALPSDMREREAA